MVDGLHTFHWPVRNHGYAVWTIQQSSRLHVHVTCWVRPQEVAGPSVVLQFGEIRFPPALHHILGVRHLPSRCGHGPPETNALSLSRPHACFAFSSHPVSSPVRDH